MYNLNSEIKKTVYIVEVYFQIYVVSRDGRNLQILLDKERGIDNPTNVRVDKKGENIVVINKDGKEIRNYKLIVVCKIFSNNFYVWD